MKTVRAHLWISGLVQGVFYRSYTRRQAEMLGLKGWVRNLPDGRVETVFEGDSASVEKMINWCQQGPPAARVSNVEIKWETTNTDECRGFEIR